ncbi:MAG: GGDEF domain-containing protein [Vicinamibacteria bacterium]
MEGERIVARIRLLILALLLVTQLAPAADPRDNYVGLSLILVAFGFALVVFVLSLRYFRPWLAVVSSCIDVSLVTAGLVGFLLLGKPENAVHSRAVFECYFLAMGCASLRYDWRICGVAGLLAVAEYAALVGWASRLEGLPGFAILWNVQISRLVILLAAAFLSVAIVLRAQRLRQLSTLDRLTGIFNRGFFDERIREEAIRSRRYQRPFTIALIDVDHFKPFNDTHGHVAGDTALQALAELLRSKTRRTDTVARFGGEEFALVLPETGGEEATLKLEQVVRAIAGLEVAVAKGRSDYITVSAGVAAFPADGDEATSVLAIADLRLYEAKRLGRNRVVGV